MTRAERRLLDVANLVVGGSGVVYGVMRYLLAPADEWAVVNHPWQPHVQHLHVVTAPLLVFAVALVWRAHVVDKVREGRRAGRTSGVMLAIQLLPMVLSGVLIQVSVSPAWRSAWAWVHLVSGSLWVVLAVAHLAATMRLRAQRRRQREVAAEGAGPPRAAPRGTS